ncbi:peptidoglycan-binding protein [Streptomyces sp. LN245]|uniref:peptidoglycan-binding domain-containing protein n=1 Tax=Streptomyces sp. LN245 TaxID=3112975 RepID=UPI0037227471
MADEMVLQAQKFVNATYGSRIGTTVKADGQASWNTMYALTRALQGELGGASLSNGFGPGTLSAPQTKHPVANASTAPSADFIRIVRSALYCKGYDGVGNGSDSVRRIQQWPNGRYVNRQDFFIVPCDGIYSRDVAKAMIFNRRYGVAFEGSLTAGLADAVREFQAYVRSPVTGAGDFSTWASLFVSAGDQSRKGFTPHPALPYRRCRRRHCPGLLHGERAAGPCGRAAWRGSGPGRDGHRQAVAERLGDGEVHRRWRQHMDPPCARYASRRRPGP